MARFDLVILLSGFISFPAAHALADVGAGIWQIVEIVELRGETTLFIVLQPLHGMRGNCERG